MCWSHFLIMLHALTLLKGEFSTDVSCEIFQNFEEHLFCSISAMTVFASAVENVSRSNFILVAFTKDTRYSKSHILFHDIMRVLCSTCNPSIFFQFFDLKYILLKTSSRGFSWSIYAYIFVKILLTCAVSV